MTAQELTVGIPIGDWHQEALRLEIMPEKRADVIDLLAQGVPTGTIARSIIVSRELEHAQADIIAPNKLLLHTGARLEVSRIAASATHTVQVKGATYKAQDFIGPVSQADADAGEDDAEQEVLFESEVAAIQPPDMPTTYTSYTNARSADVAEMYLQRRVPGHVWPRLLTLHEHGRDVRAAVQALKAELDDMALRLT